MKTTSLHARLIVVRSLPWLWAALTTTLAGIHVARALRSLVSGQLAFPLPIRVTNPVVRTAEPLLFHAGLLLLLLIAGAFLYISVKAWQHSLTGRTERERRTV